MSGEFVPTVKRVLSKHGIDPGAIELELSERGVLSGNFEVVEQLQELKNPRYPPVDRRFRDRRLRYFLSP